MTDCMIPLPPQLQALLAGSAPELGPGPRSGVESLAALGQRIDRVAGELGLKAPQAELVRALVLLWHDHLDAAHAIVQDQEGRDGSYIHAILHRREPDASNAKYWFRRVGVHPCFKALAEQATPLLHQARQESLARIVGPQGQWDASAFVEACVAASGKDPSAELLRQIQAIELSLLLATLSDCR
jgi:hypothetical protein